MMFVMLPRRKLSGTNFTATVLALPQHIYLIYGGAPSLCFCTPHTARTCKTSGTRRGFPSAPSVAVDPIPAPSLVPWRTAYLPCIPLISSHLTGGLPCALSECRGVSDGVDVGIATPARPRSLAPPPATGTPPLLLLGVAEGTPEGPAPPPGLCSRRWR